MARALAALTLVLCSISCDVLPAGPSVEVGGLCVGAVNVGGVLYGSAPVPAVAPSDVSSPFLTVTRNTGCLDTGQPADPLEPGASNFLAAGTRLHLVVGFAPTERLAYWAPLVAEWLPLVPIR